MNVNVRIGIVVHWDWMFQIADYLKLMHAFLLEIFVSLYSFSLLVRCIFVTVMFSKFLFKNQRW